MRTLQMRLWLGLVAVLVVIFTGSTVEAASFHQPHSQTYIVTYINAGAYQTKHQYAIFNHQGRVAYVNAEDVDASGNPVVDSDATKEQARAAQLLQKYCSSPAALNRAASQNGFQVKDGQHVRIHNELIKQSVSGKVQPKGKTGFNVSYSSKSQVPYATVQFKLAPSKYQPQE